MIYTLVFGAPVRSNEHQWGTVSRIIVNNGVANQFCVNPGGLFSGPERIVPINDVVNATAEEVELNIDEVEWKALAAFNIDQILVADTAAAPGLMPSMPITDISMEAAEAPTAEGGDSQRSISNMSVPLSNKTQVGDRGTLAGMVIDTGIPQELLLAEGGSVPFIGVGTVDERHITLGPVGGRLDGVTAWEDPQPAASRRLDGVTPPGTIGQERRHDK